MEGPCLAFPLVDISARGAQICSVAKGLHWGARSLTPCFWCWCKCAEDLRVMCKWHSLGDMSDELRSAAGDEDKAPIRARAHRRMAKWCPSRCCVCRASARHGTCFVRHAFFGPADLLPWRSSSRGCWRFSPKGGSMMSLVGCEPGAADPLVDLPQQLSDKFGERVQSIASAHRHGRTPP